MARLHSILNQLFKEHSIAYRWDGVIITVIHVILLVIQVYEYNYIHVQWVTYKDNLNEG